MPSEPDKESQPTRKLPPHDSWISLKPGVKVEIDARTSAEWQLRTRAVREFRGQILSLAFSIEFAVDRLICEALFPGADVQTGELNDEGYTRCRDVFDELFLKGGRSTFAG